MVKIRVSYDNEKEFIKVLRLLLPVIKSVRKPKGQEGSRHKRAYIETKIDID